MPARNIEHPWKKLYKVSTRICSPGETLYEVIDELHAAVLFRFNRRFIINDG